MPRSSILLIALLASPLAFAVGTGPTYPDDPHNPAPRPGVDSTLNPIEKPMPRDTDTRIQGNDPESPPAKQNDNRDLPGMDGSGSDGTGPQGNSGTRTGTP
ncbi:MULTISPECIES: hypothetical protein [Pseudomonas]|uniref:Lipoprotein n=2 Tax=Pseudomonas TaxID=286 RepID=A0A1L7NCF5_PSEPU|nr:MULTISPECIES: hypothetical protein [Pseudomonas]EKT4451497.1 hypothetical protein [Pseudomonas putida]EKT4561337.1 hypothetical protein [Pseudomonas putida]MBH3471412.1 hypothetical protein [Pseudomonas putida]MBP2083531.1 hypothetical protein [Pseudomonas sp. PvP089]MBP2090766.1 hypothetical protein [Pseudomonas sp. PvP088]